MNALRNNFLDKKLLVDYHLLTSALLVFNFMLVKEVIAMIDKILSTAINALPEALKAKLKEELNRKTYVVTEGVESTWHYHISEKGESAHTSLCWSHVMYTGIPLTDWDSTPEGYHIREHWCPKCHEEYVRLTS